MSKQIVIERDEIDEGYDRDNRDYRDDKINRDDRIEIKSSVNWFMNYFTFALL